ncbi:MAG: hypothetical protein EPO16_01460 [Dehalococcoidia bacterium]|nr:MAG: hypothetical protein EPO16_01460 [Dehalococcoidia bacterium]
MVSAVLFVLGLAAVSTVEATHTWGSYHWARTSNPFTLKLGDNVTTAWDSTLAQTSTDWSASTVLDTTIVPGNVGNPKRCTPTAGRVEVCDDRYGFNGWLGVASIWASGSHITQGTVKLNDSYFNTTSYNTPAWRNLVSCQEVGHTFGLAHQDENFSNSNLGTCMDYTNDPSTNQHPNQHDYDELGIIYSHTDSTTTISASTTSGNARSSAAAASCGDEHGIPPQAKPSDGDVFVCDLGNGQLRITHVFWIPPGLPGAR